MRRTRRLIPYESADVTVGLSGVSAATATGALGIALAVGLTASPATAAVGSVVGVSGSAAAITGVASSAAVGSIAASRATAISGVAASGAVGSVAALTDDRTAALSGVEGIGPDADVGVVLAVPLVWGVEATGPDADVTPSITVALSGVAATGDVGILASSQAINRALAGVAATGDGGDLAPTRDAILSTVAASGSIGSVTYETATAADVSGVAAIATAGSFVGLENYPAKLTGVAAVGAVGTIGQTGGAPSFSSPADDVAEFFESLSLATRGVDLFVGRLPSAPVAAIVILETVPMTVSVRATDYATARLRCERLYQAALTVANRPLGERGTVYATLAVETTPYFDRDDENGCPVIAFALRPLPAEALV